MPTHDIIDNRSQTLVDHIRRILASTESARFAVGYFFLSGFTAIADHLDGVKELKLLIGNTTNRETIEQMAEGYQRLDLVAKAAEEQTYTKRAEIRQMVLDTADNLRASVEQMEQTDESEALIRTLIRMIEEKRLKVRVYTKGRLHAKAYVFDYKQDGHYEKGIAIVGSSNLTLSGVTHNTELNVVIGGDGNHAALSEWFDDLWDESEDFDESLMQEMKQSWAVVPTRPYDIYMKTLYTLVRDRLEGGDDRDILWDDEITTRLADFQKVAVRQAVQMIRDYGGVFVSDVVGLGKSYIGAAIVKHFERTERARPLIICPAPLVEMWERYNEVYELNARVLSMGMLREHEADVGNMLLEDIRYRERDFVLIDESHNLRHRDTQRYRILEEYLATGRRCCLVTATPRNSSSWDVYYQTKLFHQSDKTDLPVDPPDLREYFQLIEKGQRTLPELLSNILIRRTRNHILRWYGFDSQTHEPVDPSGFRQYLDGRRRAYVNVGGRHQFFPVRMLDTLVYSIEDTYQGLYQELRGYLGATRRKNAASVTSNELIYARYGLWRYVVRAKQRQEPYASLQRAGANLRGLIRVILFKRLESSVFAFRETIKRQIRVHEAFLSALAQGIVPAGEAAQDILEGYADAEEEDFIAAIREVSGRYDAADFDVERLHEHISHDVQLLHRILALVEPITPERDAKLQTLKRRLMEPPLVHNKRLIFTQYADTARYLYDNLNPNGARDDIEVIYSGDKNKARLVGRFAPKANPEYQIRPGESELFTVVATDVLAEGLNMQDCNTIINYDLHWNPVKLIQRFGRIDRIGSEHDVVYGFNFLPETGIERNLGLRQKLHNRIQEIHDTIGEDAAILDKTENLNEEAFYAIYEKKGGQLSLFEDEDEEAFVDLNEAEELMRQLRSTDPAEYERIANLRDGIRAGRTSSQKGLYLFCQAGRFQQLFLLDAAGNVTTREMPRVLGTIKCGPELGGMPLPAGYNAAVMRVKRQFIEEVKHRTAERQHSLSLTQGQRYVMRELRIFYAVTEDEDEKAQVNILEQAFRQPITTVLNQELNRLRRSGMTGTALLQKLGGLYHLHNMHEWQHRRATADDETPKIVCSEALV